MFNRNMTVKHIHVSLRIPLLYGKTGVYRGIHIFLNFDPKHRVWVLVRTASPRVCTHNQCFEQIYQKYRSYYEENLLILHGQTFVMIIYFIPRQRRDKFVIATKARYPFDNVNSQGLSRRHLIESCEGSLSRMQTDYIDLLQVNGGIVFC